MSIKIFKMKTNIKIFTGGILFLFVLASLGGCKKYLTAPPIDATTKAEVIKDEAGLISVMNGSYKKLNESIFGGKYQVFSELLADNLDGSNLNTDFGEIFNRRSSIFGDYKKFFYQDIYQANYRANTVLENLSVATTKKDNLEGQARFIRGLAHFVTVRLFAQPYGFTPNNDHLGVPLRLSTEITPGVRATVKQVYDQIIADLKIAETKLPDDNGGYATKWAAKALLARVYFSMNDFTNAYAYSDQVIRSGKFIFETDYTKRFSLGLSTEAIFSMINSPNSYDAGGELRAQFKSDVNIPTLRFTSALFTSIASNDARKLWFDAVKYAGSIVTTKYNKDRFNVPVLHLTEMKLIRAESAAELGTNLSVAIQDVNDIMNRAYGGAKTLPANSSASLIKTNVRYERSIEMVAEGDRLYEIKRIGARGENIDKRGSVWNCPGFILQFPQEELGSNVNFIPNPEGGCN